MADLAALHAILPLGFPAAMAEIAEQLYLQLLEEPIARDRADREHAMAATAFRLVERLSAELGGVNLYLHKGVGYRLTPRNRQMCDEFRGDYKALARKYKLSEQQVRNIVDTWQREAFLQKQRDMFGAQSETRPSRARGSRQKH
ncbi:Mor transcription activator family protein [Paracidovorax anthurii]|uniref:Mor family transcriptional regulator n=1 Tax=Paracidovorax anthurii TaxID=78229 RepID=A0A328ZKZ9_9BURK|nr:Mor transcription activator family protein [Paracidovorax anthurii]RAR86065.1 Mor family transcriptional regulator [Paracidovorax anthurii]